MDTALANRVFAATPPIMSRVAVLRPDETLSVVTPFGVAGDQTSDGSAVSVELEPPRASGVHMTKSVHMGPNPQADRGLVHFDKSGDTGYVEPIQVLPKGGRWRAIEFPKMAYRRHQDCDQRRR
jgi:hypothetical protein